MQKETKTNTPVVKTQQDPTKVFTVQPKVERKLGDEFTIDDKQVVVVSVAGSLSSIKIKVGSERILCAAATFGSLSTSIS